MLLWPDKKLARFMQMVAQDSWLMFLENLQNILLNGQKVMQFKKAISVEETLLDGAEMELQVM